jgi:hypothetical protein
VKEVEAVHAGLVWFGDEHISRFKDDLAEIGIDIGPLERQYRDEVRRNPLYMWMLANIYDQTAKWFREKKIRPRLTAYLDDKIPRESRDLLQFLGRRFIYMAFPEVCRGERLFELFGGASPDFNCSVRSDAEVDGLILADIVPNAASRVERGGDPDGSFRRLLPPATAPIVLSAVTSRRRMASAARGYRSGPSGGGGSEQGKSAQRRA